MNENVFKSITEILSMVSPTLRIVSVAASTIVNELNEANDDDLKVVSGLDKIAFAIDEIANGRLSNENLPSIANEIREINKSLSKFVELIS